MKKGELVESVLIKCNAGKLTTESKVRREDIVTLLPAAINFTTISQYWINRKATGESEFSDSFISTYEVDVEESDSRQLRFIQLPAAIISLPKNIGLPSISPLKGDTLFVQINLTDRQNNSYYANSFADITVYWVEGQKVFFQNLPTITDKVLVRLIKSVSDIEDDEEIPIAAGSEITVLQLLNDWFMGVKQMPADYLNNNNNNLQNGTN